MKNTTDKKFLEEYRDFIYEMDKRYYKDKVEKSSDEVSAYDLIGALKNKFGAYNHAFFDKLQKDLNLINCTNGYNFMTSIDTEKDLRRIGNIGFYVNEDGYYFCRVYYCDGRGRIKGTADVDNFVKVDACDTEANRNKRIFLKYLNVLAEYANKHPGESYRWDLLNPQIETFYVGDDFLSCRIDAYYLDGIEPYWTNSSSVEKYALYDHEHANKTISQCHDAFLKRMPVNINDIDPLVADIVRKEYDLNGPKLVK